MGGTPASVTAVAQRRSWLLQVGEILSVEKRDSTNTPRSKQWRSASCATDSSVHPRSHRRLRFSQSYSWIDQKHHLGCLSKTKRCQNFWDGYLVVLRDLLTHARLFQGFPSLPRRKPMSPSWSLRSHNCPNPQCLTKQKSRCTLILNVEGEERETALFTKQVCTAATWPLLLLPQLLHHPCLSH